ncbi:GGDEF-domain containing protein [Pseudomonas asuensis]|uniref:GGDEF-domain containing protein n=1 Tax=Pseudomonas asuensis TaxID=1825787 RepID=A0ABQ2GNC1_9PSED|nr:GGDEF domain-containing phosphodiesterase [Pseudomonas asuensis]GGM04958.1 GGDEF-domain containing protein [Pseudomonas asuensis]
MKLSIRHSLSLKLLLVALPTALLIGLLLGMVQIAYEARQIREHIQTDAHQTLSMVKDPATQAIYRLDDTMAEQVTRGLFKHPSIHEAYIGSPGEVPLSEHSRPLLNTPTRWLSDWLFGREQRFSVRLTGAPPNEEYYGDLRIAVDTAPYGQRLIRNTAVILVSVLARVLILVLILYLVYHWILTRPLSRVLNHLASIEPGQSGYKSLPLPKGHEHNELGRWITTANQLLASIERNTLLREEAINSLQRISQHDLLTGLSNRQAFHGQLEWTLSEADRQNHNVAVLCLGLDDFKSINEQYGYQVGDRLLLKLVTRLRAGCPNVDGFGRLGGDRFALIKLIKQPDEAAELAHAVMDALDSPFNVEQYQAHLSASIGITLYPEDGQTADQLMQRAEQTMALVKTQGQNGYKFYVASVDQDIRFRRGLAKDLREALKRQELYLVYQPQIDYASQRVSGVEALLRWNHPTHGFIPPDVFIPLAERTGSIVALGEWVLEQACSQLHIWYASGYTSLRMAINLSAVQLQQENLPAYIQSLLLRHGLPPKRLELEVTETALMEDVDTAVQTLRRLREVGALIALDDFGTGYSSLAYLKRLPLDKIKIDKSFVQDLTNEKDDAPLVRAIIQLGKSLNKELIAEGVETDLQEAYIVEQGCDEGQGYFYSKPIPAAQVPDFIEGRMQGLPLSRVVPVKH